MSTKSRSRRPASGGTAYAWVALGIHLLSFVIPPGPMAFGLAFEELRGLITHPSSDGGGAWLLGLSWLANPAIWVGMLLLGSGARWHAAVAGEIAVLLAVCAVGAGCLMPAYYVWVAGMVLVVWAALRPPPPLAGEPASGTTRPALHVLAHPVPLLYPALGLPLLVGLLLFGLFFGGAYTLFPGLDAPDPDRSVHTGEDAKGQILKWAHSAVRLGEAGGALPASARNFWLYDGGTFNGSITYWAFDCGSREDCLKAVEYLGGLRPDDLKPWGPSRYAVVMEGLDYYTKGAVGRKELRSNPWDVREVTNGLVYERVDGDHRGMVYYAIDLDRNRVYYHYESGGFPPDEYRPEDAGERGQAKPR